ncbi:BZ3500_MvSof-1268-A1-R1_Chr1-3g02111 [Microbotryum saponariae]|uniref:Large ribosomal subunit protein uL29m n=1 Tax=Microbotryum saponariae TaxID=289078 RepID=A0A2X0KCL4_9BASI|nr:BZ3500_MvSof-1268-A1-R1_Chr1-3g02111 [Microbotryum saponariae]SCZ95413.1 BZ3501_MvSof-1269-A2-R1_Chr1-3g01713 [Microbotryum saponariae]
MSRTSIAAAAKLHRSRALSPPRTPSLHPNIVAMTSRALLRPVLNSFATTSTRSTAATWSSYTHASTSAPSSFASCSRPSPRFASSTAGRPKRDETTYGIPPDSSKPGQGVRPIRSETDTSAHPLWHFFHDKQSLIAPDKRKDNTSRSWTSFELRRKSFTDLHQLWYIALRERNTLLTQREEATRLRIDLSSFTMHSQKLRMVQKTMARIKQVLAERRRAALQAAEILRSRGELERAAVLDRESQQLEEAIQE